MSKVEESSRPLEPPRRRRVALLSLGVLLLLIAPAAWVATESFTNLSDPPIVQPCWAREEGCPPEYFRPPAGNWTRLASLGNANVYDIAALESGIVMAADGSHSQDNPRHVPDRVYFWHSDTGEVQVVQSYAEGSNSFLGVSGMGDTIYVFHGKPPGSLWVLKIDPHTGQETVAPLDMNGEKFGMANSVRFMAVEGIIYMFGGCCDEAAIWSYDPQSGDVQKLTKIPPLDHTTAYRMKFPVTWDGTRFLVGGSREATNHASGETIYAYTPSEDRWEPVALLPEPRAYGVIAVEDDHLWVLSGDCIYDGKEGEKLPGFLGTPSHEELFFAQGITRWQEKIVVYLRGGMGSGLFEWTPPDPETWPPPDRGNNFCEDQE